MTDEHRQIRESLGAYVLGGLDSEDRRAVERHLADCQSCRDDIARLSPLPHFLDRLDEHEAATDILRPPRELPDRVVETIARESRQHRRRLRLWQAVSAAAVLVAGLVLWSPWQGGGPGDAVVATARPVTAPVQGTAAMTAWEWGTTVRVEVRELPDRDAYLLWTVAEDGHREQAGTWGPTADRRARVVGASGIQRDRLERIEITDVTGEVLVAFDAHSSPDPEA